ncbi:MAG TPA: crotonyl-CoA carboxylase/reductase [Polyangiales bacterium]|nr:crotonyl-CoA carboxylase/reductase [Polyangiales bacterium]
MMSQQTLAAPAVAISESRHDYSSSYPVGEMPPLGVVPERMHALVVRQNRFGAPSSAFALEQLPVPRIGPRQVLVQVMAAGVNYNGVWAASGRPVDVIEQRRRAGAVEDYHIAGSDAAGIVWTVGSDVSRVKPGDHVVVSTSQFDPLSDDIVVAGEDPVLSSTARAWGYETNFGSFAQYAVVDDYQCLPKPARLSWAQAGCYVLCAGTAYRQLMGWAPHTVRPGDAVLIWGGAGALGSMAIQITRQAGGVPIAVVSNEERAQHALKLGAKGVIDRREFTHWGRLPDLDDRAALKLWLEQVRAFGRRFWEALGERSSPRIVFEHSGAATFPTSLYMCAQGGMVVTCGGTSGYNGDLDLRFLWMRQKRVQGSHGASLREYAAVNSLIAAGAIDPCLASTVPLDRAAEAHEWLASNTQPAGNIAVLIGASSRE